ncbi:MAG: radical SAM protein [Promethearchaeota archaeon]
MKKSKIVQSEEKNFFIKGRGIPKGCKYCLEGAKAVLFLNGICQKPDHCSWYCPISKERRGKDITYINEIKIISKEELLEEIKKINAKGMSITGGEPLLKSNLAKTLDYIKYVKSVIGKKFHIHLYTNGISFNENLAKKLAQAGLDEIRFHLPKNLWSNIKLAVNKGITIGTEVPLIPNNEYLKDIERLIFYLEKIGADFINLNEFEFCFPNSESLKERGYKLKENSIASVENSREFALDLIQKIVPKTSIKIHFCSIRAKDYYQLKNRYLRRAKNIKLPYEEITDEGLLLYCQIEGNKKSLTQLYNFLYSNLKIPSKLISFENNNIKIPYYIAIKNDLIRFLDNYKLEGYILEVLPFRRETYRHITEKTPIKVYLEEVDLNDN